MAAFTLNNNKCGLVGGLTKYAYTLDLTPAGEPIGALGSPIILEKLYYRSYAAISGAFLQFFNQNVLPTSGVTVPVFSVPIANNTIVIPIDGPIPFNNGYIVALSTVYQVFSVTAITLFGLFITYRDF